MAGKTGTIVAVLAGAAIGAAVGVLFAPDQGTNTRRRIKDGYGSKKGELKDKINELTETIKGRFGGAKQDLESTLENLVSNVENKKDEIIDALERKLEELRSNSGGAGNGAKAAAAGSTGSAGAGSTGSAGAGSTSGNI